MATPSPLVLPPLSQTHSITHLTIISSSKIRTKVTQINTALSLSLSDSQVSIENTEKEKTPVIVAISAKGPVVGKLISVVEIVKREVVRVQREEGVGAKCVYQYSVLRSEPGREKEKEKVLEEGDEEEEYFETMKTQAGNDMGDVEAMNVPTPRDVPVLTIYLSRTPVPELREQFGEQKS